MQASVRYRASFSLSRNTSAGTAMSGNAPNDRVVWHISQQNQGSALFRQGRFSLGQSIRCVGGYSLPTPPNLSDGVLRVRGPPVRRGPERHCGRRHPAGDCPGIRGSGHRQGGGGPQGVLGGAGRRLEFDAGLPRPEAELEAARITATLARNKRHLWSSLRSAPSHYPALVAYVPDRPLGCSPGRHAQEQARGAAGGVSGAQEVKA
jgi:hypothetical protein